MATILFQRTAVRQLAIARTYATAGGKRNQIPIIPEDQVLSKEPTQEPLSASPLVTPTAKPTPNESEPQMKEQVQIRKHSKDSAESLAARYLDMPGSSSSSLSPAGAQQQQQQRQKGAKRSLSSIEKKRRLYGRIFGALFWSFVAYEAWDQGRDWKDDYERQRLGKLVRDYLGVTDDAELQSLPGWKLRWARTRIRVSDKLDYLNKPAWDPLIPPPLPPTHQRPYTLVIELDDVLVHSEWSRDHGWRTAKRPGIEDFLGYLSQFYEIVVFTEAPSYVCPFSEFLCYGKHLYQHSLPLQTAMPILDKIDPLQYYFVYRLFRDSTRFTNGTLVKDLSYLGRDLAKVVQIDTLPTSVQTQPENAILVPPWKGSKRDSRLMEYLPFLEAIAINNVQDVRPLLKAYEGKDIPREFAARQEEYKRQHIADWERRRSSALGGASLGSMFGLSPAQPKDTPPPTFYEQERQRYLDHYKQEVKFFKDNESTLMSQMEADRERQMKEMKNSFFGFITSLGQQPPPVKSPEDQKVIEGAK